MPRKIQRSIKMRPARRPRVRVVDNDSLDEPAENAKRMLMDPCNSRLVPTVYGGDQGYVNRGTSFYGAAQGTNETSFIIIQKFGVNVAYNASFATSSTNFTVGFADTQAPMAAFLNAVASKARCAGACINVRPNASPNNSTGLIKWGVIPASTLAEGTVTNVDNVNRLLNESCSAPQALMQPLEIRWSPGLFDDKYVPTTGVLADDDTDRNILVITGLGFPLTGAAGTNGTGISANVTGIYEWTPAIAQSTSIDSTSVKQSRCDIDCVLRNLKRKNASWWWSLGKKAVEGYFTGGPVGAVTKMASFV